MPERDTRDSESTAPATPRASGEVPAGPSATDTPAPESSLRPALLPDQPDAGAEPSDTLLSAGKPADRLELLVEDRFGALDERLRELDGRLSALEQRKSVRAPEPRHRPWLWLVFLLALVVIFQMLRWIR